MSKITKPRDFTFGTKLYTGKSPKWKKNNFLEKWAWLRLRNPKSFRNALKTISTSTKARDFKFGTQIYMGKSPSAVL